MRRKWFRFTAAQGLGLALIFLLSAPGAKAGEHLLLKFNKTQGANPLSGLISDAAGELYGTTVNGGANGCGTVFQISPVSGDKWTATTLYSFQGCTIATLTPKGTMAIDKEGNLYGVQVGFSNAGQVFELMKGANDTWTYNVIYVFGANGTDEGSPNTDLTWDSAGNLYGTTAAEFGAINGEVFELSPQSNGSWKETVLYTFPAPNGVGFPVAGVIFDGEGNLYGPTYYGTTGHYGAVYELSPQTNGPWGLKVLFNSTGNEGTELDSRLVFDSSGNLYGTATEPAHGEVFELSHVSGSTWKETTVHVFTSGSDGASPQGNLVLDATGNLYGTTTAGGIGCNGSLCGVVYRLTPQSGGTWNETILHHFESAEDGSQPQAGLLLDNAGHLYGTTLYGGGRYGYGTVYEIIP